MTPHRPRWWAVPCLLPRFGLIIAAACVATPRPAGAANSSFAVTLRAGTAQEGAQHTLKGGPHVALVVDGVTGGPADFGLGLAFSRDPGGGSYSRDRVSVTSIEGHARTPHRHPAHLEVGLGYYWIDREHTSPEQSPAQSQKGLGGFVGGGYEVWRKGELGVGLAISYHAIATNVAYGGGNLEDYYALAGTIRWGGVAR